MTNAKEQLIIGTCDTRLLLGTQIGIFTRAFIQYSTYSVNHSDYYTHAIAQTTTLHSAKL